MKFLTYLWERVKSLFAPHTPNQTEDDEANRRRADNLPEETSPPLPATETEEEINSKTLWYPNRKIIPELKDQRMKTRGYYQDRFPKGAVVHFTSGRSRGVDGGLRNATTQEGQGIRSVKSGIKSPYCYFLIDQVGNVYQQFPLDRWGYHAGKSIYPGLGKSVSNDLVGIEVMCAGKVKKLSGLEEYKAWFTNLSKGDATFSNEEIEYWKGNENIERGYYHKYTAKQKDALIRLLLWMDSQSEGFNLNYVVGHDELAPGRKSDPGGSLGMTMSYFRDMLRDIKDADKRRI